MKEEEDEALTELEQELALAKASAAAEEAAEAERKAEADLKAAMAATLKVRQQLGRGAAVYNMTWRCSSHGKWWYNVIHLIFFLATSSASQRSKDGSICCRRKAIRLT